MTKEELEACIDLHGDDIYSFCSYLTGNPHDRDDLFQDTFLLAMKQRERIQAAGNVKSYLISLTIGIWKNESRKRRIRQILTGAVSIEEHDELQIPDPARGADDSLIAQEEIGYLRKEITKLPEKYRIPICLFYLENMPQEEIAKIMKIPVGTVKSRLPEYFAHMAANSRKGYWRTVNTTTVKRALSKERLIRSGFYDLAIAYQSVHVNY